MIGKIRTINRDLFVRRCVCCGYDGEMLQGGCAERCAHCGCDLRLRPARSYAEMEGLLGQPVGIDGGPGCREVFRADHQIVQRWLVFLFLSMLGLTILAYLTSAAVP
jgi:hypothetical protein